MRDPIKGWTQSLGHEKVRKRRWGRRWAAAGYWESRDSWDQTKGNIRSRRRWRKRREATLNKPHGFKSPTRLRPVWGNLILTQSINLILTLHRKITCIGQYDSWSLLNLWMRWHARSRFGKCPRRLRLSERSLINIKDSGVEFRAKGMTCDWQPRIIVLKWVRSLRPFILGGNWKLAGLIRLLNFIQVANERAWFWIPGFLFLNQALSIILCKSWKLRRTFP